MNTLPDHERANLRRFLEERFNLTELKNLAFDLGLKHELFEASTISDFARELILYCERHERLGCLIEEVWKQRPGQVQLLPQPLSKAMPCRPATMLQIIVAESLLEDVLALRAGLAAELGISEVEITLIAIASGSTRLLVSVPTGAIDFTRFDRIASLLDGRYHVLSIEAYEFLDEVTQNTWRLTAIEYPPLRSETVLYPVITWQKAQEIAAESQMILDMPIVSTKVPDHWLVQPANQNRVYTISQQVTEKLAPSERERLREYLFPRYVELAQTGEVRTAQQAAREFGIGEAADSIALIVLSVLVTAFNAWLVQQNRQTLTNLKEAEWQSLRRLLEEALRKNRVPSEIANRLMPALDQVVPAELSDIYTPYERGLERLREQVGQSLELLTYESQLRENIRQARRYGDEEELRAVRHQIVERLNRLALTTIGVSFNELCS